jgi:hypothetical protein
MKLKRKKNKELIKKSNGQVIKKNKKYWKIKLNKNITLKI